MVYSQQSVSVGVSRIHVKRHHPSYLRAEMFWEFSFVCMKMPQPSSLAIAVKQKSYECTCDKANVWRCYNIFVGPRSTMKEWNSLAVRHFWHIMPFVLLFVHLLHTHVPDWQSFLMRYVHGIMTHVRVAYAPLHAFGIADWKNVPNHHSRQFQLQHIQGCSSIFLRHKCTKTENTCVIYIFLIA